jgi:hypothetical protein
VKRRLEEANDQQKQTLRKKIEPSEEAKKANNGPKRP